MLDIFFATHDPTQLNRQGNDIGTQYRSAIFPQDEEQEREARAAIERAKAEHDGKPIVTTIEPKADWYPAEDYHQDYWAGEGQRNPYCLAIIPPKLQKLQEELPGAVEERAATRRSCPLKAVADGGRRAVARDRRDRDARLRCGVGLVQQVEQARRGLDRVAALAERNVARDLRRSRSEIRPRAASVASSRSGFAGA